MHHSDRADLYALLAETLAEPPDWMSLPGCEWPLFEMVAGFASEFEAAPRHLDLLACILPEEPHQRRERYTAIFASGKPRFWLYESAAVTGKILGPQTFEMAQLYRDAGLEPVGAELPDHILLELAFLSHLASSSQEKGFLESHAAWMIDLGRALSRSGDEVYAPLGALLADWLEFALIPHPLQAQKGKRVRVPSLPRPDDCTLCGFCVQVCPTHALKVLEDAKNSSLVLEKAECIHCGKCERICEFHALKMSLPSASDARTQTLRQSLQVQCQNCGQPVVSQAEMDYIVSQIGEAAWQHLCLDCRPGLYV
jgi:ferredoxin